jgi:acetyl-CoA acyltransferase
MGDAFMVGAATTPFGRGKWTPAELAHEAAISALAAARRESRQVAAVFVGCRGTGSVPTADALSVRLGLRRAGLGRDEGRRAEHVSASGARAFHLAWRAVESGLYDLVLCVGAERLAAGGAAEYDRAALPRRAEAAKRYMATSGATVEQLARTAAKNHRQGARNPAACSAGDVSPQAVLDSDMVAWPLTRLMVAPRMAGAAAVVLASRSTGRRGADRPPCVRASVLAGAADEARAAQLAYGAAGVGPEDVDCAEVHDDTAAAELAAYEALQFVPAGAGPELVDAGFTALGGVLPVNPSGGLLSLGEVDGVSGIAQVCELAGQLGGRAGARQVPGARVALSHARGPAEDGGRLVTLTLLSVG